MPCVNSADERSPEYRGAIRRLAEHRRKLAESRESGRYWLDEPETPDELRERIQAAPRQDDAA